MKTKTVKLSSKYGTHEIDKFIGNCYAVKKTGHPAKRYFTVTVVGDKRYYSDLIEARFDIKNSAEDTYMEITPVDVQNELDGRAEDNPRKAKWAEVIDSDEHGIMVVFRGKTYSGVEVAS